MKKISLTYKFYILFALVLVVPATWFSEKIESFVQGLPADSFLHHLSSLGVIEAPTTVLILFIFFLLFNHFLWRLPLVNQLIGIPDINGRFVGELTSSHTINDEQNGTYSVAIEIKQTPVNISVNLYTERSCSYSLIADLCINPNGNYELIYIYQNKTSAMALDADMRDHHGTALLEISLDKKRISGNYFNNPRERGRYGKITIERVTDKIKGKF